MIMFSKEAKIASKIEIEASKKSLAKKFWSKIIKAKAIFCFLRAIFLVLHIHAFDPLPEIRNLEGKIHKNCKISQ